MSAIRLHPIPLAQHEVDLPRDPRNTVIADGLTSEVAGKANLGDAEASEGGEDRIRCLPQDKGIMNRPG